MNESSLTKSLCKTLTGQGALIFAIVGGPIQETGWPDRHISHLKWTGWLEFKLRTHLSLKQKIIIRELNRRGDSAFMVRFVGRELSICDHDENEIRRTTPQELLNTLREIRMEIK